MNMSRSGDRSYSIAIGGRSRHWGKMEEVAIGRSLLQHCHWGKRSPLGEGRGRDREIAPTALPLGEEVAIGGRWKRSRSGDRSYSIAIGGRVAIGGRWKRSRSGDRSYSNAIGGRSRHWGKMEEVAIGRSLLQHCHWGKKSPLGEGRGRDREIAPTALPLGEEVASSFRAFSLIWRVSSLVWRVPSGI